MVVQPVPEQARSVQMNPETAVIMKMKKKTLDGFIHPPLFRHNDRIAFYFYTTLLPVPARKKTKSADLLLEGEQNRLIFL